MQKIVCGKIIDFKRRVFFNGCLTVDGGIIKSIEEVDVEFNRYILPGLVDAHVHVESSMLIPSRFASMVVKHGTVGVVSDPHEIANVVGESGVEFMIEDAQNVPLKFFFGAPSCVPATNLETSGAVLDVENVHDLLQSKDIWFLSEMMNFPGVIHDDPQVVAKLETAKKFGKPIDGHAPGLSGDDIKKYISTGVQTDHECFAYEEALAKIKLGMKIQIREGSAAKNFNTLWELIRQYPDMVMLCTDDSHPDDIIKNGHMDSIIKKGLKKGLSIFELLEVCVLNPIDHYKLNIGRIQVGDPADFIIVDSIDEFNVLQTYIDGELIYSDSTVNFKLPKAKEINNFNTRGLNSSQIEIKTLTNDPVVNVIEVINEQIVTKSYKWKPSGLKNQILKSSIEEDILKIVVYNRYNISEPAVGFVKGIGLSKGAIASSIAHDSHNIIAVGIDDNQITKAINQLIKMKGGLVVLDEVNVYSIPLPFGGIMTDELPEMVAEKYQQLSIIAKELGSTLTSPFMTLSFLSLLVIPELKIGDKGLFDVGQFNFVPLME